MCVRCVRMRRLQTHHDNDEGRASLAQAGQCVHIVQGSQVSNQQCASSYKSSTKSGVNDAINATRSSIADHMRG